MQLYGNWVDESECQQIVDTIHSMDAVILYIGVVSPKQEEWAYAHVNKLDVGTILGVGAGFNFTAGLKKECLR